MVAPFTDTAHPARVLFGPGRLAELGAELQRLGIRRALALHTGLTHVAVPIICVNVFIITN